MARGVVNDGDGHDELGPGTGAMNKLGLTAVACFLLSDDASYVTGSQYFVDGGMTFR